MIVRTLLDLLGAVACDRLRRPETWSRLVRRDASCSSPFARGRDAARRESEALRPDISDESQHRRRSLVAMIRRRRATELDRIDHSRRGEHPVRRRRRPSTASSATPIARRDARGRRPPRSAVHHLRRARRPLRGREDQDDRRLLHGRRRGSAPARGSRAGARAVSRSRCGSAHALPTRARRARPPPPHRDQLRAGRRGRDRPATLPLRPLGRHGEHGEPHGVARRAGRDPDHACDVGARARRLRHGAVRARRREGQGRGRDLAARGPDPADVPTIHERR